MEVVVTYAMELTELSEVTVVETLWPLPLLHVCVGAGRRTEEGLMEVPVADGGADGTDVAG